MVKNNIEQTTVLVVDDQPENIEVISNPLRPFFRVRAVRSGEHALRAVVMDPIPDLILLDVMMPKMNGFEVLARLRENPITCQIPVIFITARDAYEDEQRGFDMGAVDYITKPIRPALLVARVRLHLDLKQTRDRLSEYNTLLEERILERTRDLERSQRQAMLSEKMAAIGLLIAGIAHEINTPLNYVSNNLFVLTEYLQNIREMDSVYHQLAAQISNRTCDAPNSSDIQRLMAEMQERESHLGIPHIIEDIPGLIRESCEGLDRISKIVQDLRNFSHPGEDIVKLADINKNLDSTLDMVRNEFKNKATIIKDYGKLPQVNCYPQQLSQVFMNLLVNAAHAIEKQGEIRIITREIDDYVEISIIDTGQGIPEKNLSRIFDPFFTTKEIGKGTGLGLNVIYNIVKKHDGSIDVKSELGKGTKITIRIPVNAPFLQHSEEPR